MRITQGMVWMLSAAFSALVWMAVAVAVTGCGTWSVQFGMSEYSHNQEMRGYKPEEVKK